MLAIRKYTIHIALVVIVLALVFYLTKKESGEIVGESPSNEPQPTVSITATPITKPSASPKPTVTKVPLPSGDGRSTFIDEQVPWALLLNDASCELKGEIKFLEHNTYNNQDAKLVYKGIDHPARNVFWTITPEDDLSVGPNIFSRIFIPDGESLLGIILPDNPKHTKYELTAKIKYGRLVDEKGNFVTAGGNVKIFEKQCVGKTTVLLP